MEAATAVVPEIPVPDGTTAIWAAVWLETSAENFAEIAAKLVDEKGAEYRQRFSSTTGEPLANPELQWKEEVGGRRIHFELKAKS